MILISDACVLIDIVRGELKSPMFSLPYQFVVPDILFSEELEGQHSDLLKIGLRKRTINGALIEKAYQARQHFPRLSTNDLLALILAQHENCPLLTGDRALRSTAEKWKIEVHGTIWLVEKMIFHKRISKEVAQRAFDLMLKSGSRLPKHEIEKLSNQ